MKNSNGTFRITSLQIDAQSAPHSLLITERKDGVMNEKIVYRVKMRKGVNLSRVYIPYIVRIYSQGDDIQNTIIYVNNIECSYNIYYTNFPL